MAISPSPEVINLTKSMFGTSRNSTSFSDPFLLPDYPDTMQGTTQMR
tara:strand:- start:238 stop:378 length:141 start_codon:yes stop_codon:yes gene_type:complete